MKANKLALAVLLVLLLAPATAFADLARFGPVVPYNAGRRRIPATATPSYYVDKTGWPWISRCPPSAMA